MRLWIWVEALANEVNGKTSPSINKASIDISRLVPPRASDLVTNTSATAHHLIPTCVAMEMKLAGVAAPITIGPRALYDLLYMLTAA